MFGERDDAYYFSQIKTLKFTQENINDCVVRLLIDDSLRFISPQLSAMGLDKHRRDTW